MIKIEGNITEFEGRTDELETEITIITLGMLRLLMETESKIHALEFIKEIGHVLEDFTEAMAIYDDFEQIELHLAHKIKERMLNEVNDYTNN